MGSIVVFDKDDRFECSVCMDGSRWKAQGHDQAAIDERVGHRMRLKGCTSEKTNPVFRLRDGTKIFKCPRSIADDHDVLSYYYEYSTLRDGLFNIKAKEKPWKWHQVIRQVRGELANNEKSRVNDIKRQHNAKPPSKRGRK